MSKSTKLLTVAAVSLLTFAALPTISAAQGGPTKKTEKDPLGHTVCIADGKDCHVLPET